jgi:hypothetical protein
MAGLTGIAGTGNATVILNLSTGDVTVDGTFTGLTGPATAAHIHDAAGIIVPLTVTMDTGGTLTGGGTLTAAQKAEMIAGTTYLNIHTTAHPGGEIRGNILP